jgi:hypothetical protein
LPLSCTFFNCNWAQEVNCILLELAPLKCQENECDGLVHLLCQSEWEQREGHDNTFTLHCCLHHPNYIIKNQSEINDDSQGTERIDSVQDEADASVAQHGAGSINKDGVTGTHTTPSADPKVDAIESSDVGEKGDELAEKKCEKKDNVNGAGKERVGDKGGNGVNENANPLNYQGDGDGGNKHQKDEDTEKNVSTDGNNRNVDENDGGGEEVGAEDGKKEKNPRPSVANMIQPSPTPPILMNLITRLPKNLQSMMLQKGNKFKKGKRKRSTYEDDESNKIINCIKTYRKTLNDKILKQRSYYSDGIKDLPGNGKKQWFKELMQSIKMGLSNLKFMLVPYFSVLEKDVKIDLQL